MSYQCVSREHTDNHPGMTCNAFDSAIWRGVRARTTLRLDTTFYKYTRVVPTHPGGVHVPRYAADSLPSSFRHLVCTISSPINSNFCVRAASVVAFLDAMAESHHHPINGYAHQLVIVLLPLLFGCFEKPNMCPSMTLRPIFFHPMYSLTA